MLKAVPNLDPTAIKNYLNKIEGIRVVGVTNLLNKHKQPGHSYLVSFENTTNIRDVRKIHNQSIGSRIIPSVPDVKHSVTRKTIVSEIQGA